jgi:putative membrane protein
MFGLGRCFGYGSRLSGFGGYGPGGIGSVIPLLMGIFWLVLLAVAVYFVYKHFAGNKQNHNRPAYSSAVGILNERLAKGEISEEEYNAKKKQMGI